MNENFSSFKFKVSPKAIGAGLSLLALTAGIFLHLKIKRTSLQVIPDDQARRLMILAFQQRPVLFRKSLLMVTKESSLVLWPRDHQGESLLHWAILGECSSCVELLLHLGHPVNIKGRDGRDPLSYALEFGDLELSRALLKAGANPSFYRNENGEGLFDLVEDSELKKLIEHYR